MVVAAWHCAACDVRGYSLTDTEVRCWNCDGPVNITARPSIPINLGPIPPHVIPRPRREPHTRPKPVDAEASTTKLICSFSGGWHCVTPIQYN
jgi:hypothetical protein